MAIDIGSLFIGHQMKQARGIITLYFPVMARQLGHLRQSLIYDIN
jgi:hypothetical protein